MPEYYVRWEIDVSADDPVSAAFAAFDIYRAPDSNTTVFDVIEPDGDTYRVDLDDAPITAHLIRKHARPRPVARRLRRILPARARRWAAACCTAVSTVLQQHGCSPESRHTSNSFQVGETAGPHADFSAVVVDRDRLTVGGAWFDALLGRDWASRHHRTSPERGRLSLHSNIHSAWMGEGRPLILTTPVRRHTAGRVHP
ncbi:hypothetical protein [Nocardia vinacea]|uniref:hypothetical protein n=1 Tax=Nocardia vinacea TaxID=96468 RepID=UPI0002EA525C|nr:hypothetical protein [Nocardia vinacea]